MANHSYAATFNRGHGRVEHRQCWLMRDLQAIEQAAQWRDVGALVRIRATRTQSGHTSIDERLYITSLLGTVEEALRASRPHWGIETSLHWVLDVVFADDASRIRLHNPRQNWGALRHLALAVLRRDTSVKGSLRAKRYRADLDTRYLQYLLTLR